MAGHTQSALTTGEHIIIGGLVLQILFFGFFIVVALLFHIRMHRAPTPKSVQGDVEGIWKKHLYTLYGGSLLILVRSVFRVVEYGQGNDGYLISHEEFLYIFDALLMLVTMVLFAVVHPSEVNALLKRDGRSRAVKRVFSIYSMRRIQADSAHRAPEGC